MSSPCRISTSLPRRKFMWLSAHIQMALECIWCSNSNWTSTFRSVYEWCCIPMSELEHCGFWATVLFLQNLYWIKNIYHLERNKKSRPSNIYPVWVSVSVQFSVIFAADLLFLTVAAGWAKIGLRTSKLQPTWGLSLLTRLDVLASKWGNSHFLWKQVGAVGRNPVLNQQSFHVNSFLVELKISQLFFSFPNLRKALHCN